MKRFTSLCVGLLSSLLPLSVRAIDIPDWSSYTASLTDALQGVGDTFDRDATTYASLADQIDATVIIFDDLDSQLTATLACINDSFVARQNKLNQCTQDTETITQQGLSEIHTLSDRLMALQQTTQEQIVQLTQQRDAAQQAYSHLQDVYSKVVGDMGDQAAEFLTYINSTTGKYNQMVDKKKAFLDKVNALLTKVQNEGAMSAKLLSAAAANLCSKPS